MRYVRLKMARYVNLNKIIQFKNNNLKIMVYLFVPFKILHNVPKFRFVRQINISL